MPDLLLELFSEEIPARMQRKAAGDLRSAVTNALVNAGLTYEGAKEYWTPRRLVLDVRGVDARSADIKEEKKGPRTDAPEKAIEGFMRGAGLTSIDQAEVKSDPKKGDFYVAVIEKEGRDASEIIADAMPDIIRNFPWPKSMRWGERPVSYLLAEDDSFILMEDGNKIELEGSWLKWVRPLQSILCIFGPETEEAEVVKFEVGGIQSGNATRGHRFMAPGEFTVKHFDDYASKLEKAFVMLDAERRKETIKTEANNLAFAQGLELVDDPGLLEEVSGLVEWPTVLMGEFDKDFLDIPQEVIRLTIKDNQKCFVVRENNTLSNKFLLASNIVPSDGGTEVARGNGKVVNARLADAKFFWERDLQQVLSKEGFEPWIRKLDDVTFHAKLGTQGERVKRIEALADELAPIVANRSEAPGGDMPTDTNTSPSRSGGKATRVSAEELAKKAKEAAHLCKADLNSAMVYEFPEVQGAMGRTYAERKGLDASVVLAIEEHYSPLGPSDDVPSDPVSITVALADKLDTLVGFWAIDEKPTGSKDPFALRRAALGIIRLVLENGVGLRLNKPIGNAVDQISNSVASKFEANFPDEVSKNEIEEIRLQIVEAERNYDSSVFFRMLSMRVKVFNSRSGLMLFFHDRLKVYLRDKGIRHDLIDAVLTPDADDLLIITRKAEALQALIDSEDGKNLLAGYKRAANILAAEEKKGDAFEGKVKDDLFAADSEIELNKVLNQVESKVSEAIEKEDFSAAMSLMATLRAPIDSFFEHVLVNDEDDAVRANRLALLSRIRNVTGTVADLSKISG